MSYYRSMATSLIAIVLLVVTSACSSPGPSAGMPPPQKPSLQLKAHAVASGLEAPWGLAFLPDGRALVSERDSGKLLIVTSSGHVEEVQRLPAHGSGEGGLLGIALSPNYASDALHWHR
jgi:glucose/arabinose dehydrogenase